MIAERHFGAPYEPIERQYETGGNESVSTVVGYMNWGPHLANHGGHASYTALGCGDGNLDRDDVDALTNAPYYFVLFSIGCWSGAIDYGCIGEHFMVAPNGGTIAYVGNSRYGWGSPGNPGWGYSETFDSDFYGAMLSEGLPKFGAAVAWPKILRIPLSQGENVYRWHQYQVNLFGDPEMACHTAEITPLAHDAPDAMPIGSAQFTLTITDANGPVAGARACLSGSGVYEVGLADASGQILFALTVPDAQQLTLTITAPNHPCAEHTITAAGDEPFLTVDAFAIDDDAVPPSAGNGNGEVGAGERIELYATLHNHGGSEASGVVATLSATSPHVTILDPTATYGTLPAGTEATNDAPFVFEVDVDCPPDEWLLLTLAAEDDATGLWTETLSIAVLAPGPCVYNYAFEETFGNGDGLVDPGEEIAIRIYVKNEGSGVLGPLSAELTSSDPYVEVHCTLDIAFEHADGTAEDSFLLAIGELGFTDDMESGQGDWTHSGPNDRWHLTDYRKHSGTYSWYCGEIMHEYLDNTNASLTSASFVVPEAAELSFWSYFDVTIYGVDGLFVEAWRDGLWETLDFLGSGGALDSTLFAVDWAEYTYDLSGWTPGSTAQVRFRFVSDEVDTDEGCYVDDVVIRGREAGGTGEAGGVIALSLSPAAPNPSPGATAWRLALPEPAPVRARVYDAGGRLVRHLLAGPLTAGEHLLRWDGRDADGSPSPGGIYFLRLRAGNQHRLGRVVLIRR
jgi:hypothetical protein